MAYKHDYDKILTRLTIILSRLNDGEGLSVTQLAEEFNVSERTIQRDFNERLISFPIYQEKKKWKMQEGFKLEKSTTIEDAVVLDIMEKLVEGAGQAFSVKAEKLLSKIKNQTYNPFYAKLNMEDIGDKLKEVQQLETAIKSKQNTTFTYSLEKKTSTVEVQPLKIANYEGFWYLIALDAKSGVLKKYYLKNIKLITLKEVYFEVDERLDTLLENSISVWFDKEKEPYKVVLELSAEVAKYFKRKPIAKTQKVEQMHQDGSMTVSIEITNDMEIIPFVKYWAPHIDVTEPKRIEESIKKDLREYLERK